MDLRLWQLKLTLEHRLVGRAVLLYLNFPLTLSVSKRMGRWDCLPACRPEGSGTGGLVVLWHWPLAKCVGSRSRLCLCPKLEPLIERPAASGRARMTRMSTNTSI